jgi:hypothetical protein
MARLRGALIRIVRSGRLSRFGDGLGGWFEEFAAIFFLRRFGLELRLFCCLVQWRVVESRGGLRCVVQIPRISACESVLY